MPRQVLRAVSQSSEPGLRWGGRSGQTPQGGGGGRILSRLAQLPIREITRGGDECHTLNLAESAT